MQGANLSNAGVYDLTMTGESDRRESGGTDFSRSDLRGVVGASLSSAITQNAILPDGTIHGNNWQSGMNVSFRNTSQDIPVRVVEKWTLDPQVTLNFILDDQPWKSTITFDPGISVNLAGQLDLSLDDGLSPADIAGKTFKLFDWSGITPNGHFSSIADDIYGTDYYTLDTSHLYTTGEITFLSRVPEPSTIGLLTSVAVCSLVYGRCRRKKTRSCS